MEQRFLLEGNDILGRPNSRFSLLEILADTGSWKMMQYFQSNESSRKIEYALIILGLLIILWRFEFRIISDGRIRFEALRDFLQTGNLFNPKNPYSLVGPLFSIPLYWFGSLFKAPKYWTAFYNYSVFAIGLLCMYRLLRRQIDVAILNKFILILISASMFTHHIKFYFGEVFTAILTSIGLIGLVVAQLDIPYLCLLVLGAVNTPASLVALSMVVIKHGLDRQNLSRLGFIGLAAGLCLLESWIRRGGPFVSGYENNAGFQTVMPYSGLPGFSYPFFLGLLSILFSFGKGIFFYAPGLLLSIGQYRSQVNRPIFKIQQFWWIFLVGLIVIYSKWWSWYGGFFWGPRFFLMASLPASLALAMRLHYQSDRLKDNLLTLLALIWSIWVGINGAVYGQSGLGTCLAENYRLEFLCWYTPEFSALFNPLVQPTGNPSVYPVSIDPRYHLFLIYEACVLLYLAAPLVVTITEQVRTSIKQRRDRES